MSTGGSGSEGRTTDEAVEDSEAISRDPSIDSQAVHVLPGTGGPDDVGDIEVRPED